MRFDSVDEYLAWDEFDTDQRADAAARVAEAERSEMPSDEIGWNHCGECGVRTPHCYCPGCGERLCPPRSVVELRWMCHQGHRPTARDLSRHGVTMDDLPPVRGAERPSGQMVLGDVA